jgi:hypothetical protein
MLGPEASAQLRDRLIGELNILACGDDAAMWAHRSLPDKNRLVAADAHRVEQAFQARMTSFASPAEPQLSGQTEQESKPHRSKPVQPTKRRPQPKGIDKSTLLLAEPRRIRDREHVRYVAGQPCLICGRSPADYEPPQQHDGVVDLGCTAESPHRINAEIGRCFLRLANLDNGAFDRLTRYETALWRQVSQVLFTLDVLRRTP